MLSILTNMSLTIFTPNTDSFDGTVRNILSDIQPGHRVQIVVPRSISHIDGEHNQEELEGIEKDFHWSILGPNVFCNLRIDENNDVLIDICRMHG